MTIHPNRCTLVRAAWRLTLCGFPLLTSPVAANAADVTSAWIGQGGGTLRWTDPANWLHNPNLADMFPNNDGDLTFEVANLQGGVELDMDITLDGLTIGGPQGGPTFTGSRVMTVTGDTVWNAGGFNGVQGQLKPNGDLLIAGNAVQLEGWQIALFGPGGNATQSGSIVIGDGGQITNLRTWTINGSGGIAARQGSESAGVDNGGTIIKTGGAASVSIGGANLELKSTDATLKSEQGILDVSASSEIVRGTVVADGQDAEVRFTGPTTFQGTVTLQSSNEGIVSIQGPTTIDGTLIGIQPDQAEFGGFEISGGAVVAGSGVFDFPETAGRELLFIGGAIGNGLTNRGGLQFNGGTIAGTFFNESASGFDVTDDSIPGTQPHRITGTLTNRSGAGILHEAGTIHFGDNAHLINSAGATYTFERGNIAPQVSSSSQPPQLQNFGTLRKTTAADATITTNLTSTGVLDIQAGTLRINGNHNVISGDVLIGPNATVRNESTAITEIADARFTAPQTAAFEVASGTVRLAGDIQGEGSAIFDHRNATVRVEADAAATLRFQAPASYRYAGDPLSSRLEILGVLENSGSFSWEAGIISGNTLVNQGQFFASASPTGNRRILGEGTAFTLRNEPDSVVAHEDSTVELSSNARIENEINATYHLQGTSAIVERTGSGPITGAMFANRGNLTVEAGPGGTGSTLVGVPFRNEQGATAAESGNVRIDHGRTLQFAREVFLERDSSVTVDDASTLEFRGVDTIVGGGGAGRPFRLTIAGASTARFFTASEIQDVDLFVDSDSRAFLSHGVHTLHGSLRVTRGGFIAGDLTNDDQQRSEFRLDGGTLQTPASSSTQASLNGEGSALGDGAAVIELAGGTLKTHAGGSFVQRGNLWWTGTQLDGELVNVAGPPGDADIENRREGFLVRGNGDKRIRAGGRLQNGIEAQGRGGGGLDDNGYITLLDLGDIVLESDAQIANASGSTIDFQSAANIRRLDPNVTGHELLNAGLVQKATAGQNFISVPYRQMAGGTTRVDAGTLTLSEANLGGGTLSSGGSGTLVVTPTSVADVHHELSENRKIQYTLSPGTPANVAGILTSTGTGAVEFNRGTLQVPADSVLALAFAQTAPLVITGSGSGPDLRVLADTLSNQGAMRLEVGEIFLNNDGQMINSAQATLRLGADNPDNVNAVLPLEAVPAGRISSARLINRGTVIQDRPSALRIGDGIEIENEGGTWKVTDGRADVLQTGVGIGLERFDNDGLFLVDATPETAGGEVILSPRFSNTNGTVRVESGRLRLLDVGNVRLAGETQDIQSDTLIGGEWIVGGGGTLQFDEIGFLERMDNSRIELRGGGRFSNLLAEPSRGSTISLVKFAELTLRLGQQLDMRSKDMIVENGTLSIDPPSSLFIDHLSVGPRGRVTNEGVIETNGPVTVDDGGTYGGTGTTAADFINNGTVAPGNSPGRLRIDGSYAQTGRLELEFTGLVPDMEHDVLDVAGPAEFMVGSEIDILPLDGFEFSVGDDFTIVEASTVASADFALGLPADLPAGLELGTDVVPLALGRQAVRLTASARLAADFDLDGDVDGDDFLVWQSNFGTPIAAAFEQGDSDLDGDVDGEDFLAWQTGFGSHVVGTAGAVIPEPATSTLLALGALLMRVRPGRTDRQIRSGRRAGPASR